MRRVLKKRGIHRNPKTILCIMEKYSLPPSMSRKGNPYGNAMAESFLKTECIYRHKPAAFSEINEMINRYIHCYNHERIQSKTEEAPLARHLFA